MYVVPAGLLSNTLLTFCSFSRRMGNLKTAHEIYVKGCSAKGLDYPEYLLEAWLAFEKQNGNLADLEFATAKIKRQKAGLERKRYRVRRCSSPSLRNAR